jgi:hypothetical protein
MTGYEAIFVYGNQLGALRAGGGLGSVGGYSGLPGLTAGGLSGGTVTSVLGAGGGFGP